MKPDYNFAEAMGHLGVKLGALGRDRDLEEARELFWQLAARCEKAEAEVRRLRGDDMKRCDGCFGTGKCRDEYDRFLWICGLCDGAGKVPK